MDTQAWEAWIEQLSDPRNRLLIHSFVLGPPHGPEWHIGSRILPEHWVVFMTQGCLQGQVDGSALQVSEGECLWLNPGIRHQLQCGESCRQFSFFNLHFSIQGQDGRNNADRHPWIIGRGTAMAVMLADMLAEYRSNQPLSDWRFRLLLGNLFVLAARQNLPASPPQRTLAAAQCLLLEKFAKEENYLLSPADLAAHLRLSTDYFSHVFSRTFGVSPKTWLVRGRITQAATLLLEPRLTISEVAERSGYPDLFGFSKQFKAIMGVSPRSYRGANHSSVDQLSQYHPLPRRSIDVGPTSRVPAVLGDLTLANVRIPQAVNRIELQKTICNPTKTDLTLQFEYQSREKNWRFDPPKGQVTIPGNGTAALAINIGFDPEQPLPFARVVASIAPAGAIARPVEATVRPSLCRRAVATRVTRRPALDGRIGDCEYAGARVYRGFVPVHFAGEAVFNTEFRVVYDQRALYFGITAFQANALLRRQTESLRDGKVYEDDCIELFLDVVHNQQNYFHFIVNAANVQYDALGGPEHGRWGDRSWHGIWSSAVKGYKDRFNYELVIPFTTLETATPQPGDVWGMNLGRNECGPLEAHQQSNLTQWSLKTDAYHHPSLFGELVFH